MAEKDQNKALSDDGFEMLEDSSVPVGGRRREPAGGLVDLGGRVDLNANGSNSYFDVVRKNGLTKDNVEVKYGVNFSERCVTVHVRPKNTPGCTDVTINDRNGVSFNILSVFERYPKLQPAGTVKAGVSTRTLKGEMVLCISLKGAKEHHSQSRKSNSNSKAKKTKTESKAGTDVQPQQPEGNASAS